MAWTSTTTAAAARALWDEPRAITLSVQRPAGGSSPAPASQDRGGPGADGTAINVPLPRRTADGWVRDPPRSRSQRAVRPTLRSPSTAPTRTAWIRSPIFRHPQRE